MGDEMTEEKTVKLKNSDYQPSKAELEEHIKPDVPGESIKEKMDRLADAVMAPAKIKCE